MKLIRHRPAGLFENRNFMTPHILGYYKLRKNLGYAELSEGTGLRHQPIFGVTVQPTLDLSKLFQSQGAALDYIRTLSEE